MDADKLALLVELLPTARSFRDLTIMLAVSDRALRKAARPFLDLMELSGTHPMCGCGRLRYHQGACIALNQEKWANTPGVLAKRAGIVGMLRDGATLTETARAFGMSLKGVRAYYSYLSDDEKERMRAQRRRRTREDCCKQQAVAA